MAAEIDILDLGAPKTDPSFLEGKGVMVYDKETGSPDVFDAGRMGDMVPVLYGDLVALRDAGHLKPGRFYRITDYVTATAQTSTSSAGHTFDVIVLALDSRTLSEDARALRHEGDTYFANCNLEAWELKYCLDDDTERFDWAKTGITCTVKNYDNVLQFVEEVLIDNKTFYRWRDANYNLFGWDNSSAFVYTATKYPTMNDPLYMGTGTKYDESIVSIENCDCGKGVIYYMKDEWSNEAYFDFKNLRMSDYGYMFSEGGGSDLSMTGEARGNIVRTSGQRQSLPSMAIGGSFNKIEGGNMIEIYGDHNVIGCDCTSIRIGDVIKSDYNVIGDSCAAITLESNCSSNRIESGCTDIYITDDSHNVEIMSGCYDLDFSASPKIKNIIVHHNVGNLQVLRESSAGGSSGNSSGTGGGSKEGYIQNVTIHHGVKNKALTLPVGANYAIDVRTNSDTTILV